MLVNGQLANAELLCRQCLEEEPQKGNALNCLGIVKNMQQDFGESAKYFALAIEANPKFAEAHNNLGTVLMGEPPSNGSIDCGHFSTALALDPKYLDARENRANCAIQQAAILPEDRDGLAQRAKLFEQARADLAIVLTSSSSTGVNLHLGVIAMMEKHYEEAERLFLGCIEARPQEAGCRGQLGNLYLATGRCADSVRAFRDDLELNPHPALERADQRSLEAACEICPESCRPASLEPSAPSP